MSSSPPSTARQPRRVAIACKFCRRRKIRCEPQLEYRGHPCRNCLEKQLICEYVPVDQDGWNNAAANQQQLPSPTQGAAYSSTFNYAAPPSEWSTPASQGQSQASGLPGYPMPGSGQTYPSNHSSVAYPGSNPSWPSHHPSSMSANPGSMYFYSQPNQNTLANSGGQSSIDAYTVRSPLQHDGTMTHYCLCMVGYACVCHPGHACECPNARPM